jgi:hypothetical protein
MQPRRQHYQFSHVVLRGDVHKFPDQTWDALTGADVADYLAMQWQASKEGDPVPAEGLGVEGVFQRNGWEILVVRMPPPEAPTEAHYVAIPRRPEKPADAGYFVMEKGFPDERGERAYGVEWRSDGSLIRMGDLPAISLDVFLNAVGEEISARGSPAFAPISLSDGGRGGRGGPGRIAPTAGRVADSAGSSLRLKAVELILVAIYVIPLILLITTVIALILQGIQ